jgi:molybdenum cofactor cytidylyltransferase
VTVAAIILAAGNSTRFEDGHKLLALLDGVPLVRHVATALEQSDLADIVLVTGANTNDVLTAVGAGRWRNVENKDPSAGLSSSLRVGIQTIRSAPDGVLVALGDMPGISIGLVQLLLAAFLGCKGQSIVFPVANNGRRGHPVIWPRALFAELERLSGDTGGKTLLADHRDLWLAVPCDDAGAFADIDTRADLDAFGRAQRLS